MAPCGPPLDPPLAGGGGQRGVTSHNLKIYCCTTFYFILYTNLFNIILYIREFLNFVYLATLNFNYISMII